MHASRITHYMYGAVSSNIIIGNIHVDPTTDVATSLIEIFCFSTASLLLILILIASFSIGWKALFHSGRLGNQVVALTTATEQRQQEELDDGAMMLLGILELTIVGHSVDLRKYTVP
jgi:hypothetical protein